MILETPLFEENILAWDYDTVVFSVRKQNIKSVRAGILTMSVGQTKETCEHVLGMLVSFFF
ncbi:MAG: hypothetical protein LE180_05545 [Endomicrobium sp.]|uniref:hypothetical protein n=1 Tax=Candidatus Endomicrobiellum pyrsonymphae TaxID=1408203 RepID=UPI00357FC452|nr:hypothetical protein [Endomicrobium sp.]